MVGWPFSPCHGLIASSLTDLLDAGANGFDDSDRLRCVARITYRFGDAADHREKMLALGCQRVRARYGDGRPLERLVPAPAALISPRFQARQRSLIAADEAQVVYVLNRLPPW